MDADFSNMAVGSNMTDSIVAAGNEQLGQMPQAQPKQAATGTMASTHPRKAANRWTAQEHARLCQLVELYGPRRWPEIAAQLPGRKGKQCRERWLNHGMDPRARSKKGNWTPEEEYVLVSLHAHSGTQWRRMVEALPGRTDNDIKNHFYATWRCKMDDNTSSMLWVYIQQLKQSPPPAPVAALNAALVIWESAMPKDFVQRMLGYLPSQHPDGNPDGREHPLITISPTGSEDGDDQDEAEAEAGLQQLQQLQQEQWGRPQGPPTKRVRKSLEMDDDYSQEGSSRNTNAMPDATGGEVMQQQNPLRAANKMATGITAPEALSAQPVPVQILTPDGIVTLYANPGAAGGNALLGLKPPGTGGSTVPPGQLSMVSMRGQPVDANSAGLARPSMQGLGQGHLGSAGYEEGNPMVTLAAVASMQDGNMAAPPHVHRPVPRAHSSSLSTRTILHPSREESLMLLASRSGSLPSHVPGVAGQLLQASPPQQPCRQLSSLSQQMMLAAPASGPSAAAALLQASVPHGTFSALSGSQLVGVQQTGLAGQQPLLVQLLQPGANAPLHMAGPMQVDNPFQEQLQLFGGNIVQQLQQQQQLQLQQQQMQQQQQLQQQQQMQQQQQQLQQQQLQQQLQWLSTQHALQHVVPAADSGDFSFQLQSAIAGQIPVPPQSSASVSTHFAASTSAGHSSHHPLQFGQAVMANNSANTSPTLASSAATPTAAVTGQYAMLTMSDGSIQLLPLAAVNAATPAAAAVAGPDHGQQLTASLPTAFSAATAAAAALSSQPPMHTSNPIETRPSGLYMSDSSTLRAQVLAVPEQLVSMASGNMPTNLPTAPTAALLSLGSGQGIMAASHGQAPGSSPLRLSLDSQKGSSHGHGQGGMGASMLVLHNQEGLQGAK